MNEDIKVLLNSTRITSIRPIAVCMLPKMFKIDELMGICHGGAVLFPVSDVKYTPTAF